MSCLSAIVLKGIRSPNTAIAIVKAIVVGVKGILLPGEVPLQARKDFAGIIHVAGPVQVPQQFVEKNQVHIVMVHDIRPVGAPADIAIAVHRRAPLFRGTRPIQLFIL